jgi:hypothetical protein
MIQIMAVGRWDRELQNPELIAKQEQNIPRTQGRSYVEAKLGSPP